MGRDGRSGQPGILRRIEALIDRAVRDEPQRAYHVAGVADAGRGDPRQERDGVPGRRPYCPLVNERRGQLPQCLPGILSVGDDGTQQPGVIIGLAEGLLQFRPRDLVEFPEDLVGGHRLALGHAISSRKSQIICGAPRASQTMSS